MPSTVDELVRSRFVDVGGLRLHVVEAGSGPLVVLLHGFPDFWYGWRHQIPALVAAGYRVVAPDLRGYHRSDKPRGVAAYRGAHLERDVARLIPACGVAHAAVVGHDWGGQVAWTLASRHPQLVERLVIVNVPHPARFLGALRDPRQLARSWYIAFFQLPWLPELALRAFGFAALRAGLRRASLPGAFTEIDVDRHVRAAAAPGALTAGLNYYRAAWPGLTRGLLGRGRGTPPATVRAPTLVLWGDRDPYLRPPLAEPPPDLVPHARVERLPHAGHWPHADDPARVNALLLDFLQKDPDA